MGWGMLVRLGAGRPQSSLKSRDFRPDQLTKTNKGILIQSQQRAARLTPLWEKGGEGGPR